MTQNWYYVCFDLRTYSDSKPGRKLDVYRIVNGGEDEIVDKLEIAPPLWKNLFPALMVIAEKYSYVDLTIDNHPRRNHRTKIENLVSDGTRVNTTKRLTRRMVRYGYARFKEWLDESIELLKRYDDRSLNFRVEWTRVEKGKQ